MMVDEEPIRTEQMSTGQQRDDRSEPDGVEEDATLRSATDKGKGKAILSSNNRIHLAGKALLNSALNDLTTLGTETSKRTEPLRPSSFYSAHRSIHGSQGLSNGELPVSLFQTLKCANDPNDAKRTESTFNTFATGDDSIECLHPEYLVAQTPDSAKLSKELDMDGMDLVRLLSQPERYETPPLAENDQLSSLEVARLRQTMFATKSWPVWDQLLNFNPDFLVKPEAYVAICEAQMGTSNFEEARNMWLQQWKDVLSGYTDEVWGDLSPLAENARSEILKMEQLKTNGISSTKALKRLRLVLAHVRGFR